MPPGGSAQRSALYTVGVVSDRDYPAVVLRRRQSRVQRQKGRIRLRQDELPVGWRIAGHRHHDGRVAEINSDLGFGRPFPAESVEQRQGQAPATGRIYYEIGFQGLRAS